MDQIILLTQPITRARLGEIAAEGFGDMVKAVVDVEKQLLALGGNCTRMGKRSF